MMLSRKNAPMMRWTGTLFVLVAAVLFVVAAPARAQEQKTAEIVEVRSAGGVTAWLKQESAIPMIAVSALWRDAGSVSDPVDKAGRANLVSGLLDEGAGDLTSQAFQQRLEELAVRLSFEAGRDSFSMDMQTLTQNAPEAFRLVGQALTAPRFDAEPVERIRRQILTGIARDARNPNAVAGTRFMQMAFPDDPYGRPVDGTAESVAGLQAADFAGFVRTRLARNNLILGVVGDIGPEELKLLLDAAFAGLPETAAPLDLPATEPVTGPVLDVAEFPSPQTVFVFGLPALSRDDPDFDAARVMNHMLGGGGFTSRLTEEIREKRGLTYGVYSYLRPMDRAGLWLGGLSTRNEKAGEALQVLRDTMRDYIEQGPGADQLRDAKANMNGAFPLRLTSNKAIAGLLVSLQRYDLGKDYVARRPQLIDAVTAEDVKRVARRLLDPERLLVVAAGQPAGLAEGAGAAQ